MTDHAVDAASTAIEKSTWEQNTGDLSSATVPFPIRLPIPTHCASGDAASQCFKHAAAVETRPSNAGDAHRASGERGKHANVGGLPENTEGVPGDTRRE